VFINIVSEHKPIYWKFRGDSVVGRGIGVYLLYIITYFYIIYYILLYIFILYIIIYFLHIS